MKFNIIYKVEAIAKRRPNMSQTQALVEEGILSKSLMEKNTRDAAEFYGDDWVTPLYKQIDMLVNFISTSISLGLGIPEIGDESLVAKAAYNVAKATEDGIPRRFDISQEFYRLLMEVE